MALAGLDMNEAIMEDSRRVPTVAGPLPQRGAHSHHQIHSGIEQCLHGAAMPGKPDHTAEPGLAVGYKPLAVWGYHNVGPHRPGHLENPAHGDGRVVPQHEYDPATAL